MCNAALSEWKTPAKFKSESAPCIKYVLSKESIERVLKRIPSHFMLMSTWHISILPAHLLVFSHWSEEELKKNCLFVTNEIYPLHLTHPSAHTPGAVGSDTVAPGEQSGAQGSHLSRGQFQPEPRFKPTTSDYKSDTLSIRAITAPNENANWFFAPRCYFWSSKLVVSR